MSNEKEFLKQAFASGSIFTGFVEDPPDKRDYKFSDLMKKQGMTKTVKRKVKKITRLPGGIYRKAGCDKVVKTVTISEEVPTKLLRNIPSQVDHSTNMSRVKDQGRLGSCVGFAAVAMKECQEQQEHKSEVLAGKKDHRKGKIYDYSEQWVYRNCKKIDGYNGQGTYLRCAMKVLKNIGVPTEKGWPYTDDDINIGEPKGWANLVSRWAIIDSYWSISSLLELKVALVDSPVMIGVPVFEEWRNPPNGVISYPRNPDRVLGGHAICAVAFSDKSQLVKFKNSWGSSWGESGYGYLSYSYINDFLWSAWVAKDISVTRDMLKGTRELTV